jgi:MFS family permease
VAGIYILINSTGGFFGAQVNAYCSDRLGRRTMFRIFGLGFVAMASFYLLAPLGNSAWTLLPVGMVYGFFQFGLYASFGPYFTELFPTEMRGSGQSFAYNLGRAMSGLVFTLPVALVAQHYKVSISVGMLVMALSGIVLATTSILMLPETAGRDLRDPLPQ